MSVLAELQRVRQLFCEGRLQPQSAVIGGGSPGQGAVLGQGQAQGSGEGGQVLVNADGVVVALPLHVAGLRSLPRAAPAPLAAVPPLLGPLPLAPHDDGQRVDEKHLHDLDDTHHGAAHPQAQLAPEVGQQNDELEEQRAQGYGL